MRMPKNPNDENFPSSKSSQSETHGSLSEDSHSPASHSSAWEKIAPILRGMVREHAYERWFSDAQLEQGEDGSWVLSVPSDTHCLWIETNFMPELCAALDTTLELAEAGKVKLQVSELPLAPLSQVQQEGAASPEESEGNFSLHSENKFDGKDDFLKRVKQARLNPTNSFERFVVGSNEFAHAACLAVGKGIGQAYNPLFIHGDSGMGKTHLAQALGQECLKHRRKTKVVYLTCERFTNEFIEAVQKGSLDKFRANYRKAQVLIVDDIQFLKGKEKTGDEFFHTFNALLDLQAQIIITSDRPACEIQNLESRLVTRFESGLTVELQPPSLEMRIAILQKKMEEWKVEIPHFILTYIAERVKSSIRRLEGALVRVATYCSLGKNELDIERTELLLVDILREEASRKISIDTIQNTVANFYDLRVADMTGRRRPKNIAHARQVAMYLSRKLTKNSLMEIGEAFGGRDHGTIIHAVKKMENLISTEDETKQAIEHLASKLNR